MILTATRCDLSTLRLRRALLLALVGLSLVAACRPRVRQAAADAAVPGSTSPSAAELVAQLRLDLAHLRPYRAVLVSRVRPEALVGSLAPLGDRPGVVVATRTRIWADRTDRTVLEVSTTLEGEAAPLDWRTTHRLLFDGQTVWVERRVDRGGGASPTVDHFKLDQRRLTSGRAHLDVGVTLWGHGLREGHALAGTVRALLDRYSFAPQVELADLNGQPCLVLRGRRDPDAALRALFSERDQALASYLRARQTGALPEQVLEHIASGIVTSMTSHAQLRIYLGESDRRLRGWAFGADSPPAAEVQIEVLEPLPSFPAGAVRPTAEMVAQVEDRTEQHLRERALLDQAFQDAAGVRAARAHLRELLDLPAQAPSSLPAP